ncbi:hypothetical protein F5B22DRAFT_659196 [Xylaria bambusicola]|uniref:uncharacterized protein n=1 Tax=Xylaria bambusicola TaxID=326684 RepID=UPI0020075220|nr:uncharacterized protein F5B22DRAFT_659196 [Xylaria bambusicola]KAI0508624.1 hypothetical protein F5B22DRAFT_659196 [Xylaria bambusicola]
MANFKVVNSHQLSIVVVPIVTVLFATVCVILRFRARHLQKAKYQWDDWICLISLVFTWAFQAVNLAAVFVGGAGLPIATVIATDLGAVVTYLKIILVNFSLWVVTVSLVQLSILFFYIRIFGIHKLFRRLCWANIILISAFGLAGLLSEIFHCIPVSKSWNPMEAGTCVDGKSYCASIGVIHLFFDLSIVLLPMPLIWNLRVTTRSKFVLSVVLALGLVATLLSLLKISCIIDLTGIPQEDVTDSLWLTILLQTLELPIGIICCCVPVLRPAVLELKPLFNSFASRLISITRGSGSGSSPSIARSYSQSLGSKASSKVDPHGFVRLHDAQTDMGTKATAQAEDVQMNDLKPLSQPADAPQSQNSINITNSYSVSRY